MSKDSPNEKQYKSGVVGKIIYIDIEKGWGYINSHEIKFSKIYFHWTGLKKNLNFSDLKEKDSVKFNALYRKDGGWKAINIEAHNEPTTNESESTES